MITNVTIALTKLMQLDAELKQARLLSSTIALSFEAKDITESDYDTISMIDNSYVDEYIEANKDYIVVYIDLDKDIASVKEFDITNLLTMYNYDEDTMINFLVSSDNVTHTIDIYFNDTKLTYKCLFQ